jgi:hypothetical protein
MAYSAKVGSFNINTAKTVGQTQAITGIGFQPKIVLFWWGGSTGVGDTVAGGTYNIGFGAAISSSSRFCCMGISEDAQADSDSLRSCYSSEVMRAYTNTSTLDGILDFTSMDVDGFTLTIDDQFTQAYRVSYLALGGTDLTDVYIGNKAMPATTGNYNVTGVGFQPDAVITAFTTPTGGMETNTATLYLSIGMATGASHQGIVNGYSYSASATSAAGGYGYDGQITENDGSFADTFVSFGADGFTLNHTLGDSVRYFCFICLKGGQYSVSNLLTRTDGNDIVKTVGFQPVAVLFASANRALSTIDVTTNNLNLSIGAGTSASNRACAAVYDENGLATTETAYGNYDSEVYAYVKDDAMVGLMDIKSIDVSGFTCVMDDTDPSACWVTYLAIGQTIVTPARLEENMLLRM